VGSFPYFALWACASLFRRFADTNAHGTGSVKIWKTPHEISVDIRIFFCSVRGRNLKREDCAHRPSRLLSAVSRMAMLAEGRVGELHIAVMMAMSVQTTLVDSSIDPELLFTTPPSD